MNKAKPSNNGILHTMVIAVTTIFVFFKFAFPYLARYIANAENLLPVPDALLAIFMVLTFIAAFIFISITDTRLNALKQVILDLVKGKSSESAGGVVASGIILILIAILIIGCVVNGVSSGSLIALFALLLTFATLMTGAIFRLARSGVFVFLPLLVGWFAYSNSIISLKTPTALRIQHPTIPGAFEKLENPFRNASAEQIREYILEGRDLYQKNCRPCHGTKAAGDGPMARAFRLKPANFRDPGTIATVVESYAFWRIKKGGPGLPREASPWDSAMPIWENDLTDEEIWKIIMAEYQTAGVEPRIPEKLE